MEGEESSHTTSKHSLISMRGFTNRYCSLSISLKSAYTRSQNKTTSQRMCYTIVYFSCDIDTIRLSTYRAALLIILHIFAFFWPFLLLLFTFHLCLKAFTTATITTRFKKLYQLFPVLRRRRTNSVYSLTGNEQIRISLEQRTSALSTPQA